MTKATLNEFISHVKNVGLPTSTHFQVFFPGNEAGRLSAVQLSLCDGINLPGMSIMTQEHRITGELTELPHAPIYNQVTAQFMMDNTGEPRTYFMNWLNKVYDRETRSPGYYQEYTQDVNIYITDKTGRNIYKVTLYECYPKTISDIPLDYSSESIIKLTVNLVYKWAKEEIPEKAPAEYITRTPQLPERTVSGIPVMIGRQQNQSVLTGIVNNMPSGVLSTIKTVATAIRTVNEIKQYANRLKSAFSTPTLAAINAIAVLPDQVINQTQKQLVKTAMLSVDRDMRMFSDSITGLSNTFENNAPSAKTLQYKSTLAAAIANVAGTLGSLQQMFIELNVAADFSQNITRISSISTAMASATTYNQMQDQLKSFGQVFAEAGRAIESSKTQLSPSFGTEFRMQIETLSASFLNQGSEIQNVANILK